jgi:dihydrofolate reductase
MRVLLLAAITVDGKIARTSHELTTWSSREDRREFAATSREAGVIIMGRNTYQTLPAPLPERLHVVMTRHPDTDVAVADSVEFTSDPPQRIVTGLAARGYTTAVLAGGAQAYRTFLDAGLVDELRLTVEPLAFGAGISLFGDIALDLRLELMETRQMGEQAVQLRYRVVRHG